MPFHGSNRGSTPRGDAIFLKIPFLVISLRSHSLQSTGVHLHSFALLDLEKMDFTKNGVRTGDGEPRASKASPGVRQFYQEDKIARREPRECRPKGEPQDVASDSPWGRHFFQGSINHPRSPSSALKNTSRTSCSFALAILARSKVGFLRPDEGMFHH